MENASVGTEAKGGKKEENRRYLRRSGKRRVSFSYMIKIIFGISKQKSACFSILALFTLVVFFFFFSLRSPRSSHPPRLLRPLSFLLVFAAFSALTVLPDFLVLFTFPAPPTPLSSSFPFPPLSLRYTWPGSISSYMENQVCSKTPGTCGQSHIKSR